MAEPASTDLDAQRRRLQLSTEDCWVSYFALGGRSELAAIRAFFRGDRALPQAEVDILAAAIVDLAPSSGGASDAIIQLIAEESVFASMPGDGSLSGTPSGPIRLTDVELLLRSGRTTTVRETTPTFPDTSPLGPAAPQGSLLRVDSAIPPDWEIHPSGDELLVLLTGEARIEIDRIASSAVTLRAPYDAYVIPRGRWHRHLAADADTKVMFLTPTDTSR